MQQINIRGTFLLTKACVPYLRKSPNAHVLTISPPLNMNPYWLGVHPSYTLSKYGMTLLALGWAEEYRGSRSRPTACGPGPHRHRSRRQLRAGRPDARGLAQSGSWPTPPWRSSRGPPGRHRAAFHRRCGAVRGQGGATCPDTAAGGPDHGHFRRPALTAAKGESAWRLALLRQHHGDGLRTPRAEAGAATRHRLDVIAGSVPDVIRSAGGWLADRALAGWDVNVFRARCRRCRALADLGVTPRRLADAHAPTARSRTVHRGGRQRRHA